MKTQLFSSEPMRIGLKEWRVVVYEEQGGRFTDYEWRYSEYINRQSGQVIEEASEWKSMRYWPDYNSNDGMFAGCPRTLRRLYEKHRKQVEYLAGH